MSRSRIRASHEPALATIDLEVRDGDLLLVAGASGSGKSTLLRVPPGLVPHHSGGTFSGRICLGGRDVTGLPPRDLAGVDRLRAAGSRSARDDRTA